MGKRKFLLFTKKADTVKKLISFIEGSGWEQEVVLNLGRLKEILEGSQQNEMSICLAILNPENNQFTSNDLDVLRKFSKTTNCCGMIVASGDDEACLNKSNLNAIISDYGFQFRKDCVIRPNLICYKHPKEALLQDFVSNRGLEDCLRRISAKNREPSAIDIIATPNNSNQFQSDDNDSFNARILYAYGCSLKITDTKKCVVMMTSSKWALPTEQPICVFHKSTLDNGSGFRLVALGSASMFNDQYLECENNLDIFKSFLDFITNRNFAINMSDAKTIEIPPINYTPDIDTLMSIPIAYVQRTDPMPEDKSTLIDKKLFTIDNSLLPSVIEAFRELDIAKGPLTLIKPNFERYHLSLEPAIHRFLIRRPHQN